MKRGILARLPAVRWPDGVTPRAVAVETGLVVLLGCALAACSIAVMAVQQGADLSLAAGDLPTVIVAGIVVAAVVRLIVRIHRVWRNSVGRITAAAALCALAAAVGTLVVMIPPECPGEPLTIGRCDLRGASSWGLVAGLATVVNFGILGLVLGLFRGTRNALRDASVQVGAGVGALRRLRLRVPARGFRGARGARGAGSGPRASHEPKGRPTPRRADAERARRNRLRGRT